MPHLTYPPKLSLANIPTPLERLERVSQALGVNIWMKRDDLTGSVLSGNKIRKLEFTLAQAQLEGCDTLITCGGLQSNHCRATALLGAQLGFDVHLMLRGEPPLELDGNLLLDTIAGARIETFPARDFAQRLPSRLEAKSQALQSLGRKPYIIPTGASDDVGCWGYVHACAELRQDFEQHQLQPEGIYAATGSGGTQAGLTLGAELFELDCPVIGVAVCDDAAYFQQKVRRDMTSWLHRYGETCGVGGLDTETLNIHVIDDYIGPGYALAGDEVYQTIAWLARQEGIVLDPVYTGKAFHGLVSEIKLGNIRAGSDVVFIHTGGVFGVFPDKLRFSQLLS